MPTDPIVRLASRTSGIITLDQVRALGHSDRLARARVDRGQWRRLLPGVYLAQSEPASWDQLVRAALAWAGPPAAISHSAAGWMHRLITRKPSVIDVTVPRCSGLRAPSGSFVRVHRATEFPSVMGQPFRYTMMIPTLMDLINQTDRVDDVVGLLTAALRHPVMTEELWEEAWSRPNLKNRSLIREILTVAEEGVESPLEYRFHRDVERAHGLPRAERQGWERTSSGRIRYDARYPKYGVRVELDGELAHPGRATPSDLFRDNDVLIDSGDKTLRYRWIHIAAMACRSGLQLGRALRLGGWQDPILPCGGACAVSFQR